MFNFVWIGARVGWLTLNPRSIKLEPWSIGDIGILDHNQLANGPGVKWVLD
jgi:hypothetical protein